MVSYTLTDRLTVFINSESYQILVPERPTSFFKRILELVNSENLTEEELRELKTLLSPEERIKAESNGDLEVLNGEVLWNGEPLHNVAVTRLLELQSKDLPFSALFNFLNRLVKNPSSTSISELYDWLANKGLPITPRGTVLGYKAVNSNYTDYYSGKFDNTPGHSSEENPISMPRGAVDDERSHTCSVGFHIGALPYAYEFMKSGGHIVLCEFDPADAVSVPIDCEAQKLRVSKYWVLEDYNGPLPIEDPVYKTRDEDEEYYDQYSDDDDYDDEDDLDDDRDFCPVCDESIYDDYMFCPSCGEAL